MSQWHAFIKNDPRWHEARVLCFERDDYACVDCGTDEDLQADHTPPLSVLFASLDHSDAVAAACDVEGLATRCGPCNRRKAATVDQPVESDRPTWVNPKWSGVLGFGL